MERSEQPTKKKLEKVRKKGMAPFSQDLTDSLLLTAFFSILILLFKPLLNSFERLFKEGIFSHLIFLTLLILIVLVGICLGSHWLQKGFLFSFKKKEKIKERPFYYNLLLLLIKIALLVFFTYLFLKTPIFFKAAKDLLSTLLRFGLMVSLAFLGLGILDWLFGRYFWKKAMKMTKEEVKDEKRQSDGDSQIKDTLRKRK